MSLQNILIFNYTFHSTKSVLILFFQTGVWVKTTFPNGSLGIRRNLPSVYCVNQIFDFINEYIQLDLI